ncbi:unnamed protein product [Acidithrix sp. C25]|nr:unnamed protein product [Acidithrix sp. C25]
MPGILDSLDPMLKDNLFPWALHIKTKRSPCRLISGIDAWHLLG